MSKKIFYSILPVMCIILLAFQFSDNELNESIKRGEEIYKDFCVTCHMADGSGIENVFPPVAGADYLLETPKKSIHAIKYGLSGPIKVNGVEYNNLMSSQGLTDQEIADVMNYMLNSWGNEGEPVTVEMVKSVKK